MYDDDQVGGDEMNQRDGLAQRPRGDAIDADRRSLATGRNQAELTNCASNITAATGTSGGKGAR
jgi:hypothetical protein